MDGVRSNGLDAASSSLQFIPIALPQAVDPASNEVNVTIGLQVNDTLAPDGWRLLEEKTFTDVAAEKAFYRVFVGERPKEP